MGKREWERPHGCECDEAEPARWRCTAKWMRCNARIKYERERRLRQLAPVPSGTSWPSGER